MIQDTHRTQVLEAIPAEKVEEKRGRTKTGTVLVLIGLVLVAIAFVFGLRFIDGGAEITLLVLGLLAVPLGLGVLLIIVGATVWSGELVTAGFKDVVGTIGGIVRAFRKNGNGGTTGGGEA